jgi:hypothetical protein
MTPKSGEVIVNEIVELLKLASSNVRELDPKVVKSRLGGNGKLLNTISLVNPNSALGDLEKADVALFQAFSKSHTAKYDELILRLKNVAPSRHVENLLEVTHVLGTILVSRRLKETTVGKMLSHADFIEAISIFPRVANFDRLKSINEVTPALFRHYRKNVGGHIREIFGRSLNEIEKKFDGIRDISNTIFDKEFTEFFDSIDNGSVFAPIKTKEGVLNIGSDLRLGPDRIVGHAMRKPFPVTVYQDGISETIIVSGELDIRGIVEVKGVTTASAGKTQILDFIQMEDIDYVKNANSLVTKNRGSRGIVRVGNEYWALMPIKLENIAAFVVSPEGGGLASVKNITSLHIPNELEKEILEVTDIILETIFENLTGKKL